MKKSTLKKVFALMLALVLAFAMSVPAFAATSGDSESSFTITITPGEYTDITKTTRYKAYEIFTGRLTEAVAPDTEENLSDYEKNQLADIKWGEDINAEAFVAALVEDEDNYFNGAFDDLATKFDGEYDSDECAAEVAKILADIYKDDARTDDDDLDPDDFAKNFAVVAKENLKNPGAKPVSSSYNENNNGKFTIKVKNPGYYLITDEPDGETGKRDTVSEHILQVVRNRDVEIKSDAPTSKKEKVTGNGGYEIGQTIKFQLIGTIAENFKNYKNAYKYTFIDTMSKGLTLDQNSIEVKVYSLKADGSLDAEITTIELIKGTNAATSNYTVSVTNGNDGSTTLTVAFDDLREIEDLLADYAIVVTYDAVINEKAEIGTPEENTFKLEFSNDPYDEDSTNETPEDTEVVETFEIDIIKMDSVDTTKMLAGVKFHLYKVEEAEEPTEPGQEKGEDTILYAIFDDEKAAEGLYTLLAADGWSDDEDDATDLITIEGGKLNLKGLGVGTYYLEEAEAYNGYNTLPGPVKIEITASYVTAADVEAAAQEGTTLVVGEVKSTTVTVSIDGEVLAQYDETRAESLDPAFIPINVYNVPASSVPSTGGIGNYIFYIGGGVLLVVAAIAFLFVSKKKTVRG